MMRNLSLFKSFFSTKKIKSEEEASGKKMTDDDVNKIEFMSGNVMREYNEKPGFHSNPQGYINNLYHQTINSTIKRRFSESYYRNVEISKRPRLVKKCGELNIHMESVPKHKRRLLSDFFNTILDIKWRWHIAIFLLSFLVSWIFFASIWYAIALLHGDLKIVNDVVIKEHGLHANGSVNDLYVNRTNQNKTPCVYGVHDFTSALLYSVETQHTIGYGLRHITEECSFAIIFLMLQSCFGIFVQGLVAGVVFAKISRPNKRKRTIIFSHNAVVSERDGKLCFMFKLANVRISQLSDAKIKLLMIKSRRTDEGEFIPFQSFDMKVGNDWSSDNIFFPWPKTVEHIIDENSPFYDICKDVLGKKKDDEVAEKNKPSNKTSDIQLEIPKNEDFEIVVILEGNIETTGASCHIRTSYLPQEILFGYRFKPIYPKFTDFEYLFDYSQFDQVEEFQRELWHLNVAFNNPQLNYIYDARYEDKNYHLTYQNTVNKKKLTDEKQSNRLSNIFAGFKSFTNNSDHNLIKSKIGRTNLSQLHAYNLDEVVKKNPKKKSDKESSESAGNSPYQTLTNHAYTNNQNNHTSNYEANNSCVQNTITTLMIESRRSSQVDYEQSKQVKTPTDNEEINSSAKSGRFTVVPVGNGLNNNNQDEDDLTILKNEINLFSESNNKEIVYKKNEDGLNKRKPSPIRLSKQVLFQSHLINTNKASTLKHTRELNGLNELINSHQRANSLPPINKLNANNKLTNGKNSLSNEDEGYLTNNKNSKNELDLNC